MDERFIHPVDVSNLSSFFLLSKVLCFHLKEALYGFSWAYTITSITTLAL